MAGEAKAHAAIAVHIVDENLKDWTLAKTNRASLHFECFAVGALCIIKVQSPSGDDTFSMRAGMMSVHDAIREVLANFPQHKRD